jgi:transposase-like protein
VSHGRSQHPNAPLTPEGRRRMVDCVLVRGWTVAATAERFQVDAKTVRKWRDRFLAEGEAGLCDRSSRPRSSPNRTPRAVRRRVVRLRKTRRKGAAWIGHHEPPRVARRLQTLRGWGHDRATKAGEVSGGAA